DVVQQPQLDLLRQGVGLEVVVESQWHEVAPLFAAIQMVDGDDPVVAAAIERPDDSTADEASGPGDENSSAIGHGYESMVLRLRPAWDGWPAPPGSVSNPCIVFRKNRDIRHPTSSTSIPRTQSAMRTTGMPGRLVRLAAIMVSMFTPLLLAQTQTPPASGT